MNPRYFFWQAVYRLADEIGIALFLLGFWQCDVAFAQWAAGQPYFNFPFLPPIPFNEPVLFNIHGIWVLRDVFWSVAFLGLVIQRTQILVRELKLKAWRQLFPFADWNIPA